MKTSLLFLSLLSVTVSAAAAESCWVMGVTAEKGWFDAEKTGQNDALMCWAAASANAVAWWQAQNKDAARKSGAPTGLKNIWKTYREVFGNSGGLAANGINWWFSGDTENLSPTITGKGAYYRQAAPLAERYPLDRYLAATPSTLTGEITAFIRNGCAVTLGLYHVGEGNQLELSSGHAVTLWGVDLDDDGVITTMYLTDSDDRKKGILKVHCTPVEGLTRSGHAGSRFASFRIKSDEGSYNGQSVIGEFTVLNGAAPL